MTGLRGWGLPEQHLALDALVAFVDGELSRNAHDRAVVHLAHCPACAADATAQRQARSAVQEAETPSISSSLMQALQAIPSSAELPDRPDELAVTEEGQLVAINRRDRPSAFGGAVLGSSTPLGGARQPFGSSAPFGGDSRASETSNRPSGRRGRQGAGVVFSGLVLGALALMNVPGEDDPEQPTSPLPLPGGAHNNAVVPASAQDRVLHRLTPPSPQPRVTAGTTLMSTPPTSLTSLPPEPAGKPSAVAGEPAPAPHSLTASSP